MPPPLSVDATAGVIAPPPLIALATLIAGLALDQLLPALDIAAALPGWPRIVAGLAAAAAGGALALASERQFKRAGTEVKPWRPSAQLVTSGPFRYLRNPMYVSLAVLTGGIAFALGSGWTLVLMVPAALVMHFGVVRREERYLSARFGDAYRDYMARVPRYGWPLRMTS
jgi:protein-S-isoprenylcysteine O-methyltransferase Ste14